MTNDFNPDQMPRSGTGKMVAALIAVPAAVLLVIWGLVRIAAGPEISEDEIIDLTCDTDEEVTTFRGQVDQETLHALDFDSATLRVEFTAFLARSEASQRISLDEADPETGLIDLEITQEIAGPANCSVTSFVQE